MCRFKIMLLQLLMFFMLYLVVLHYTREIDS
jgi:hypothetical protein